MIVLYYTLSNASCRKAKRWFKEHEIEVVERRIQYISRKDLLRVLTLSENGFFDLMKRPPQCEATIKSMIDRILGMSFNEGVDFVLAHPETLKTPLIISKNKFTTGYNDDAIRAFIPSDYRSIKLTS